MKSDLNTIVKYNKFGVIMDAPIKFINVRGYSRERSSKSKMYTEKAIESSSKDASYWNILHIFGVLLACLLQTSIVTLIPRQNSVVYPDYWYEGIIVFVLGVHLQATANLIMEAFIFLDEKSVLTSSIFLVVLIELVLSFIIPYCMCYIIWTFYLGYNYPIPFLGACGS